MRLHEIEFLVAISLIPLVLAPGVRRIWRSLALAWARRRRRGRRIEAPVRWLLIAAALIAYPLLLRDRHIMSDGWGVIGMSRVRGDLGIDMYREPGVLLVIREAANLLRPLGINAAESAALTSWLAMIALFALFGRQMSRWQWTRRQRALGWALALSCLGLTQMLLGHVEVYPLLILGTMATMTASLAAAAGRCSPGWPAAAFALTVGGHLSGIFLLPAVVAAVWVRAMPDGGRRPRMRPLMTGLLHLLAWGLLVHVPLWTYLMLHLEQPDQRTPLGLFAAMQYSLNTGAEGLTFIGSSAASTFEQLGQILATHNLAKVLHVLFYLSGGPLLVLCVLALGWPLIRRPSPAQQIDRRSLAVVIAGWLGYGFYTLTWHNDWPWHEDWDLFSAMAPLTLLLAARLLMPAPGLIRLPRRLVLQICLFAIALGVVQHYFNHTRVCSISAMNKVGWTTHFGQEIQEIQFERAYPRSTAFARKDGKPIIIPPAQIGRYNFKNPPEDQ
jgi:hypothetical protein